MGFSLHEELARFWAQSKCVENTEETKTVHLETERILDSPGTVEDPTFESLESPESPKLSRVLRSQRSHRSQRSVSRFRSSSPRRGRSTSLGSSPKRQREAKIDRERVPRRSEWAGTRAELGLPSPPGSRRRSRSSSGRRTRTPRRKIRVSRSTTPVSKTSNRRRSKWDVRPDPSDPDQKLLSQRGLMDSVAGGKKRRECYVGNLPQNKADEAMLREAFTRLFHALPAFVERYPDVVDPVKSIFFPPKGEGMFAFVEFMDDVLTTTAIAMNGFEMLGRHVRVGRPQHYIPAPNGENPQLDVQPLRERGLISPIEEPEVGKVQVSNVMREVYFGNLAAELVDEQVIRELVEPAMHELPEYSSELGPPITKVSLMACGRYCFVQFQNAELATRAITIFDDTELFGRRIRVSRPSKYSITVEPAAVAAAGAAAATALMQPGPSVSPAKLPPELLQAAAQELQAFGARG